MPAFAFYLLKVIICSGILFGYYWLMLRNKIFHRYNRFFLLAVVVLSLALPLIQINIMHSADEPAPKGIRLLQVVNGNEYLDEIVIISRRNNFTTQEAILLLYSITSFIFLSILILALIKIRSLFIKNRHSRVEDIYFVNTTANGTPFSFLKYIFWNDHIDPDSATGRQIFKHELAHVQQMHSYDKLFLNATLIVFWCNPFFWLIRKELNIIHEFMADKIAVEDSDTEAFAAMILQAAYPHHRFTLSNPFFYSPIKRRIMMLTKNRNSKAGYIGRLMVLPLAILVFAAFTLKAKTFKSNLNYNGKTITVVIDAGHGGSDNGAISLTGNVAEKDLALAIIKKIKALNNNSNINIILTRQTDVFQSVQEKATFTKAQKADLFVSIHIDATTIDSANSKSGMSVWVAKDNYANADKSKLFASAIINEFGNNYKLPVAGFPQQRELGVRVLQESLCPSVLIEAGYITNAKDLAYLKTEAAKESIAKNVLAAIEIYAFAKEKRAGANAATAKNGISPLSKQQDIVPEINIKGDDKALVILDGKTISNDELKKINSENIKSVEVIKDKAALAKYGDKGKNGVILIISKEKSLVFNNFDVITHEKDSATTTKVDRIELKINNQNIPAPKPLFVIDGKEFKNGFDINSIAPDDIESIEVLKDKMAEDKYGERGKAGVIIMTTKSKKEIKEITTWPVPENNPVNQVVIKADINTKNKQTNFDDRIFTKVENEPTFPGGDTAWKNYLQKNLDPTIPVDEGWKEGVFKVIVSFIVGNDGTITDVKSENYQGSKTSMACINLIKNGPKWNAAVQNGHPVNAYKKQPITFVIEEQ